MNWGGLLLLGAGRLHYGRRGYYGRAMDYRHLPGKWGFKELQYYFMFYWPTVEERGTGTVFIPSRLYTEKGQTPGGGGRGCFQIYMAVLL